MKGLLIKDFLLLYKQMKVMLVIVVIFAIIPNMSAFAVIYASMMPITLLSYDEKSNWDRYALTLPVDRKDLALSKYILGFVCLLVSAVISLVSSLVFSFVGYATFGIGTVVGLVIALSIGILFIAINFPLMYSIGVEKGRFIFLVVAMLVAVGGSLFSGSVNDLMQNRGQLMMTLAVVLPFASIVAAVISIFIAAKIAEKKDY